MASVEADIRRPLSASCSLQSAPEGSCSRKSEAIVGATFEPKRLDGGWGWIICIGSFIAMVIMDGVMFSAGIFYIEWLEVFGESKSKTALVGSVLMGCSLVFGPITSGLVNVWGCRVVTCLGSLVSSCGFAFSCVAADMDSVIVLQGLLAGLGMCMMYIPSILIVGFYFDKKRAFANGLSSSGSGVGAFLFPPVCNWLLSAYGWRGSCLIIAGFILNILAIGMLYRPIPLARNPTFRKHSEELSLAGSRRPEAKRLLSERPHHTGSQGLFGSRAVAAISAAESRPWSSVSSLNKKDIASLRQMYRKEAFYSGSMHHMSCRSIDGKEKTEKEMREENEADAVTRFSQIVRRMANPRILRRPKFLLLALHFVLWTTHLSVLVTLPDLVISRGFSKFQASTLLSIIGVSNIFGRVAAGWVSDRCRAAPVSAAALLAGAVVCWNLPFCRSLNAFRIMSTAFGVGMGTWTSLRPILIVQVLGLDALTNSFGLIAMFQGIAFCVGTPLAGGLFDVSQSFVVQFVSAGFAFLFSGCAALAADMVPPAQTTADMVPPTQTTADMVPPTQTTADMVPPAQTTADMVPPAQTTATGTSLPEPAPRLNVLRKTGHRQLQVIPATDSCK